MIRPLKDGVVSDFNLTSAMLNNFFKKSLGLRSFNRPRVVVGVPAGVTQVEKRGVLDVVLEAGAASVEAIEEPMAAAVGAGLPVTRPVATTIIDIGGGTTEIAVISLGGTVYCHSLRVAGDEMDEAISRYLLKRCGLEVSPLEVERVKLLIGSAIPFKQPQTVIVSGRDIATGFPAKREVSDREIREGLSEIIFTLLTAIRRALESLSPELTEDVAVRGISLTGGGSLLKGLPQLLAAETGIPCSVVSDPLSAVVRGAGLVTEEYSNMCKLCVG